MSKPIQKAVPFLITCLLLLFGAVAALLPGQAAADKPSIVEIASGDDRFETLVAALQAADLVETLQGQGPFTVFAPTDDAFAKLPDGTLEALLNDIPTLQKILLYHVAGDRLPAAKVVKRDKIEMLAGEKASIKVEDGKVFINDAQIIITDIKASNGIIHVIDTVIIPPSLQPKPSIVEIASGDDRFETLVAALQAAELVDDLQGEGPFTVLAPTDDAFAKLPDGTLEALLNDIPTLQKILLYHVAAGKNMAADVVQLTELETLQGEKVQIRVEGHKVFVNDARIIITDIEASNGVIHVIDTVLIPPSLQPKTIVDIAVADDRFETLVAALQAADLVETLQGDGPFTVFAPTDDAFAKLPAGTLEALLNDIPALKEILLYHVVPGKLLAADVVQQTELTTAQGHKVKIRVEGGKVFVNDSEIIITDIEASNGVIHVIDTVLIPSKDIVDIAVEDGRFKTLVAALQAAGLVETLQGDGPFTVLAPTDNAFAKLPKGTLKALLNDIPTLNQILLYHVVAGKALAADVVQQTELTTVQGEKIKVRVEGDKVFVNDARIRITDIEASNGVIHVIDTVLTPPSLRPKVDVTVVHGIPGQALGVDSALPVDVSVDGACVLPGFTFSQVAGPLSLPVDTYRVAISLANAAAPCSNAPVIGPLNVPVAEGENVSIVAHLNGRGEPTASKFVNNVAPLSSARARLVVHHLADAGAVDVKIFRRGSHRPVEIFQDVAKGSEGVKVVTPGRYNTQVFAANNNNRHLVQSGFVGLKARNLYIEYVFGSPKSNSLTIVTQTIPLPR